MTSTWLSRPLPASSEIALFTSVVRGPKRSTVVSTARATSASTPLSARTNTARPPAAVTASSTARPLASERPVNPTAAPSAASISTIPRPMPRVPPVTSAIFSSSRIPLPLDRERSLRTLVAQPGVERQDVRQFSEASSPPAVGADDIENHFQESGGEMIRLAQLYTGGVGSEIVRRLAGHRELELVAVLVHSDEKAGLDSGTLVGGAANGIVTTQSIDDVLAALPDAAIYSGMLWDVELIARLLREGVNVYTGMGGYYLPGQPEFEMLDAAGRAGNASLAAGGNIPGLISDVFPLFVSGYTGRIREIRVWQRNHVSTYPSGTQIQTGLGIGLPPTADEQQSLVDGGWVWAMRQSANLVAAGLGIECTDLVLADKRIALAPEDTVLPGSGLLVAKGTLAGAQWTFVATSGDRKFLTITNEQTGGARPRAGLAREPRRAAVAGRDRRRTSHRRDVRVARRRGTGRGELAAERGPGDEHRPSSRGGAGRLRLRARLPGRHRRRRSTARLSTRVGREIQRERIGPIGLGRPRRQMNWPRSMNAVSASCLHSSRTQKSNRSTLSSSVLWPRTRNRDGTNWEHGEPRATATTRCSLCAGVTASCLMLPCTRSVRRLRWGELTCATRAPATVNSVITRTTVRRPSRASPRPGTSMPSRSTMERPEFCRVRTVRACPGRLRFRFPGPRLPSRARSSRWDLSDRCCCATRVSSTLAGETRARVRGAVPSSSTNTTSRMAYRGAHNGLIESACGVGRQSEWRGAAYPLAMTRRRAPRTPGRPMWPGSSLARWSAGLAVVVALVAAPVGVSRVRADSSRPGSGPLDGLTPAAAPMGWNHFYIPVSDGVATLGVPPQFAPFAGDPGTASAAVRDATRRIDAYLNITPRQGDERLRGFAAFRVHRLADEHDQSVHLEAAARARRCRAVVGHAYSTTT